MKTLEIPNNAKYMLVWTANDGLSKSFEFFVDLMDARLQMLSEFLDACTPTVEELICKDVPPIFGELSARRLILCLKEWGDGDLKAGFTTDSAMLDYDYSYGGSNSWEIVEIKLSNQ